jgi:molybdate/tungstate transport system substrate-binding protein
MTARALLLASASGLAFRFPILRSLIPLVASCVLAASAQAQEPACAPDKPALIIYHAGSLSAAFKQVEKLYTERTGVCVKDFAGGSVSAARTVTAGREPCDIYAAADYEIIDQMMKPARVADYTIRFGAGGMVLAYRTSSKHAETIARGRLDPPASVPEVAPDWYEQMIRPGVSTLGSNPFLDPGGYRADLIFQLAQAKYGVPNLYSTLLEHHIEGGYAKLKLGTDFDYQFTYEHSAITAFRNDTTGTYRFARLPDDVSLASPGHAAQYAKAGITIPGLQIPSSGETVRIPATRVTWGLTVMKAAPHPEQALEFLKLLLGPEGVAIQSATGPTPISPAIVSRDDLARLPAPLRSLVRAPD